MQDSEYKRVLRLSKGKLRKQELVFVVGMTVPQDAGRVADFVKSGQIAFLHSVGDLLSAGTDANSLIFVHKRDDETAAGKVPGKVELIDQGCLKRLLSEITQPELRLLLSEMEADAPTPKPTSTPAPVKPAPSMDDIAAGATGLTPMQQFATRFLKEVDSEGVMTAIALKRLLSEIDDFDFTNAQLAQKGWLEPWRQTPESKVSGYTATDKLRELADEVIVGEEPSDPYQRAQFLVASESAILARKAELEAELREISAQLERVAKAKAWLARGTDF